MKRVAVLYGGISAEREVSLVSGTKVAEALAEVGYEVVAIEVGRDLAALIAALTTARPDVAFNALHGRYGEDGCIQGILEWLGIPYTHSGVRASALAMDKAAAKACFAAAGLPVAPHRLVTREDVARGHPMPTPYVLKPIAEGSSVGVVIVREGDNRREQIVREWTYGPFAMAEAYVPGRELTVGVLGDRPLAVTEIATAHGFYDYEAKYRPGESRHLLPAPIHPEAYDRALGIAAAAHRALGCRGASRADLRYDDSDGEPGRLVLLEVNTQPGMTPTSLLPEQASHCGMSFAALCVWMVEEARCGA